MLRKDSVLLLIKVLNTQGLAFTLDEARRAIVAADELQAMLDAFDAPLDVTPGNVDE